MPYNVSAIVKNNADVPVAYEEFFTSVELVYLLEAFLEFFGMETIESQPTKNMPPQNSSMDFKSQHFDNKFEHFFSNHVFHVGVTAEDKVQNYGLCLIELFAVLRQLNDAAHEGDGYRNVTTWTYLMLLLKANNNLSKYAIDGMYFLTLTKCLLTHQMSERVNNQQGRKNWSKHA